jgi:hypothetical protein
MQPQDLGVIVRRVADRECLLPTEREADVSEAPGKRHVLLPTYVPLIVEENDLARQKQPPDLLDLGTRRLRHVDAANDDPDTRRYRLDLQTRSNERLVRPGARLVTGAQRHRNFSGIVFVHTHAARVGTSPARGALMGVSVPRISPPANPTISTQLRPTFLVGTTGLVHSAGFKEVVHDQYRIQKLAVTVAQLHRV